MADTRVKRQNPSVTMEMCEVYNELIKDLLQVPGSQTSYLELGEHAEKGTFIKVCMSLTHCILVDSSTVICWTNLIFILGMSGLFCHFYSIFDGKSC